MATENTAYVSIKVKGYDEPAVLEVDRGTVQMDLEEKYTDNRLLRTFVISESLESHKLADFWDQYKTMIAWNIESIVISFENGDDPIVLDNVISSRYQWMIMRRSEEIYPRRLMFALAPIKLS